MRSAGLLTIEDAAKRAGVSPSSIIRWIRRDRLPTVRIGRGRYIRPDDLDGIVAAKQVGGVVPAWRRDPRHAGMRLRALREAAGLDQIEPAAVIGGAHEHISRLELGQRAPRAETIRDLARALGVEPERFVVPERGTLSTLNVVEAAARLDVTVKRVQTWLRDGVLPGTKVSGEWRVPRIVVEELDRSGRPRGRSRRLDPRYRG